MELAQNAQEFGLVVVARILTPFAYPVLQNQRIFALYLLTSFAIAVAAFAYHHRGSLKQFFAYAFPRAVYGHGSARVDYRYFVVNTITFGLLFAPIIFGAPAVARVAKAGLAALLGVPGLGFESGWGAALALTVLAILAFDFAIFAGHWLQHFVPTLWEFHKVHHSAEVMTPITVYRMHPVDDLLIGFLVALCTGLAQGLFDFAFAGKIEAITAFKLNLVLFLFYVTGYNLRHSHIWLDYPKALSWLLLSPATHQIHHSSAERHWDKNLGFIFSFWDRWAGTLYLPERKEELVFGLSGGEHRQFDSVWRLYTLPVRKVWARYSADRQARDSLSLGKLAVVVAVFLGVSLAAVSKQLTAPPTSVVSIEDLTWVEVRDAIRQGKTVAIVPTGGTEQNGPHLIMGKHNYIVRHTATRVAETLGNALVAPVIAYVPEGSIDPPGGHMAYPGTISLPEPAFAALLEATARSLKAGGFKTIVFLGDSGGNQRPQEEVAARLDREWEAAKVRVVHAGAYYGANGQIEALLAEGESRTSIGSHAGIRDTSEVMAIAPHGVRPGMMTLDGVFWERTGVIGDPTRATPERGVKLLQLKIDAAVREIRRAMEGNGS